MYLRRFILSAVACAPMLAVMSGTAQAQQVPAATAQAFINQSGQQLVTIVNSSASTSQKAAQLHQLVEQIVAVDQIGDYVLGRYINVATPDQHTQFLQLFHELLSYNITYQIKAYAGISLVVNNAAPLGDDMVVNTTINAPGKAPETVGWAVDEVNGAPKIVDVIVAGTSLRITTRNDYASVVIDNGGAVSALLNAMQNRVTQIAAQ